MTPEKQRIAIAEACGWTGIYPNDDATGLPRPGRVEKVVQADGEAAGMDKQIPSDSGSAEAIAGKKEMTNKQPYYHAVDIEPTDVADAEPGDPADLC